MSSCTCPRSCDISATSAMAYSTHIIDILLHVIPLPLPRTSLVPRLGLPEPRTSPFRLAIPILLSPRPYLASVAPRYGLGQSSGFRRPRRSSFAQRVHTSGRGARRPAPIICAEWNRSQAVKGAGVCLWIGAEGLTVARLGLRSRRSVLLARISGRGVHLVALRCMLTRKGEPRRSIYHSIGPFLVPIWFRSLMPAAERIAGE